MARGDIIELLLSPAATNLILEPLMHPITKVNHIQIGYQMGGTGNFNYTAKQNITAFNISEDTSITGGLFGFGGFAITTPIPSGAHVTRITIYTGNTADPSGYDTINVSLTGSDAIVFNQEALLYVEYIYFLLRVQS